MNAEGNSLHTAMLMLSAAVLSILGVDYYALIWGFAGALWGMASAQQLGRTKALVSIVLSTLVGAAIGTLAAEKMGAYGGRTAGIVMSLVVAAGAQQIIPLMIRVITSRLERIISGAPAKPGDRND